MYNEEFTKAFDAVKKQPYIDLQEMVINDPVSSALIETFEILAGLDCSRRLRISICLQTGF